MTNVSIYERRLTVLARRRVDLGECEDTLDRELDEAKAAFDDEGYEILLARYHACIASRRRIDAAADKLVGYVPGSGPGRNGDEEPDCSNNPADDELCRRAFAGERDALVRWHVQGWLRTAALAAERRPSHAVRRQPFASPHRRAHPRQSRAHSPRRRSAVRCRAAPGRPSDGDGEPPHVDGCAARFGAIVRRILRDVIGAALAQRDRSSGRPQ